LALRLSRGTAAGVRLPSDAFVPLPEEFSMTMSMSTASLPVLQSMLANLSHILAKAAAHA
jgi:hypothetical protein